MSVSKFVKESLERVQVTLTVEEAKEIIARGVINHPQFIHAQKFGRIVFKGGTTVSRITEKLSGPPVRISGRITKRGTVSSLKQLDTPHTVLLQDGVWRNIDQTLPDELHGFTRNDLIITGANAIDCYNQAAMMAGSPGGGNPGQSLSSWYSEGVPVLIVAGIEKLIPGNLTEIIQRTGRTGKRLAWGMAVGLMPIPGELITEIEAIKLLAEVDAFVIGSGGLGTAQGATTIELLGQKNELDKLIDIFEDVKRQTDKPAGDSNSLTECQAICDNCQRHLACGYKNRLLTEP